jgi:multidrug efflux pump subunit AcrA (membrane-fusion protein)
MTAEVKIVLKRLTNILQVPLQTVTEFEGKNVVYVSAGGRIERRQVEIGDRNDTMIQVLSGVDDGELLALDARTRAAADTKAAEHKPGEKKPADPDSAAKPAVTSEAKATPAPVGGS